MTRIWNKHKINTPLKKKVFVGMSGGVDSSVSAALLKKEGYDVTGVFIKVWQPEWLECNWREERLEAMRAAAHLDIPFITLDLEKEYKKEVIDYMVDEYSKGRTPNPDVMCNCRIKFGAFYDWAMGQGADFVATGHYASVTGPTARSFSLLAGRDENKDQSYFLWTLKQEQLPHILFPVGNITKPEVRKLAEKFKLPNAGKKDSQGLCFIGKVDVKEFLKHYIKTDLGDVLDEAGEKIGRHPGALLFTIGERHGFTIDSGHKSPEDRPRYVIGKDIERNTITVSNKDKTLSLPRSKSITPIIGINWIKDKAPAPVSLSVKFPFWARSRYRQKLQKARILLFSAVGAEIEFEKPQDTLTSGQSLVVYDGQECLGGGIIE